MKFPILYHKGRTGAVYSWKIWVEDDQILTEYGQIDGEKQVAQKRATPKNEGRANATTAQEQAVLEAQAMWKFKLDRKYSETVEASQAEVFLPMLAHDYAKRGKKLQFPVDLQYKYDGVRTIAYWEDGAVRLMSRSGKDYYAKHIVKALEKILPKGTILDGEIYQHGVGFQTISRLIKKERPESKNLEYHVYDVPVWENTTDHVWHERCKQLYRIAAKFKTSPVKLVQCETASNFEEVQSFQGRAIAAGFEGTIIRIRDGVYEFGYRSPNLLKFKEFDDDEFEVVSYEDGVGKYEGCVTWICKLPSGKQFKAVPKGTLEEKKEWFDNAKRYLGQFLKVKYQGVSEDGIPRFPVGIGFRDMENDK